MRIEILTVPGCPNRLLAVERVGAALAAVGRNDVAVVQREAGDAIQARRIGLCGSPTILVDGHDPFAGGGLEPSVSCRLYRDGDAVAGAPSVEQLSAVLSR